MEFRSAIPMRIAKLGYMLLSVFFCGLGIFFIVKPEISITTIGIIIGSALIVFGGVKLVGYFSKDLYRLAFQFDLQFGILLIVLGLITLIKPDETMTLMCIMFGIAIFTDSLFKITIALQSKKFGIKQWPLVFVLSLLTAVVGLLLIFRPLDSAHAIMVLFGVSLLVEGILSFCVAVTTVKVVKDQKRDNTDTFFGG